ncbi:ADPribosylation factor subfamily protein [Pelomyxa schiedti]|nr:ADPribosylation factor subfamily protein [Pelomyxa schiedti]
MSVVEEVFYWGHPIGEGVALGEAVTTPTLVPCLSGLEGGITHVSCGQRHVAVLAAGEILVWGLSEAPAPQKLPFGPYRASTLTCGRSTVWTISGTHDHIWVWDLEVPSIPSGTSWCNRLPKNFFIRPVVFRNIFAGGDHLLIQPEPRYGPLFSLGNVTDDQCDAPLGECSRPQANVPRLCCFSHNIRIEKVAAGSKHTLALSTEGALYTWGFGLQGQLGNGDYCSKVSPESVTFFQGSTVTQIACGDSHSLVVNECGMLFSFGENSKGQLGLGDNANRNIPCLVAIDGIAQIAAGCTASHSIAVTKKNSVYSWGSNEHGQLGLGDTLNRSTPTEIATLKGKNDIVHVACCSFGSFCVVRYYSPYNSPATSTELGLFATLHTNVLIHILSLLDAACLCKLCCTCRTMNHFASSDHIWKTLYESRPWSRTTAFLMNDHLQIKLGGFNGNWKKRYLAALLKETKRLSSCAISEGSPPSKPHNSLFSSIFFGVHNWISRYAIPRRVLVLGLDAAGKTTMLYKIKLNDTGSYSSIPSFGYNIETVEFKNLHFVTLDIWPCITYSQLLKQSYHGAVGIIFVVDSCDLDRAEEARTEFHKLMIIPELSGLPVLFYANKQDLLPCMSPQEVAEYFSVGLLTQFGHPYQIRGSCAITCDGVLDGLDWLFKMTDGV